MKNEQVYVYFDVFACASCAVKIYTQQKEKFI